MLGFLGSEQKHKAYKLKDDAASIIADNMVVLMTLISSYSMS